MSAPRPLAAQAAKFLLELAMLLAYGVAAYRLVPGAVLGWAAAIGVPVLVAIAWGLLVAPSAPAALPIVARVAITATIFAGASTLLAASGLPAIALALFAVFAVDEVVLLATGGYPVRGLSDR